MARAGHAHQLSPTTESFGEALRLLDRHPLVVFSVQQQRGHGDLVSDRDGIVGEAAVNARPEYEPVCNWERRNPDALKSIARDRQQTIKCTLKFDCRGRDVVLGDRSHDRDRPHRLVIQQDRKGAPSLGKPVEDRRDIICLFGSQRDVTFAGSATVAKVHEKHVEPQVSQASCVLEQARLFAGVAMEQRRRAETTRRAHEAEPAKPERWPKPKRAGDMRKNGMRMVAVSAVYEVEPYVRQAQDILRDLRPVRGVDETEPKKRRPKPQAKRVSTSVLKPMETLVRENFDDMQRRDPQFSRCCSWRPR